ncbi:eukaryotic translation initiation factor eIF2A-domain-containing protein [Cantharellus anzutake]|uniref:eukaryotic translation initiation factor eIF2A-domain-containing protein n=1 Tax=Cantharellus anzutake TaxID=1750568 RepID=UPI0019071A34|nr:eukaryotic translation initiation factor eIF2A-domain-containing protein [Cantharellus anzutake]KAF8333939.1 eukaryotic translation initiation factor eIF2A-domain-containing protein [Cantharellus anzutake]
MASSTTQVPFQDQYAYRAQKSFGIVAGSSPNFGAVQGFQAPDVPSRTYIYSQDGKCFAYAVPASVLIFAAENVQLLRELDVPNAIELNFSPLGTFLSTWERQVKPDEGGIHKNLRVWSVATGEEVTSFAQKSQEGWDVQYTSTESHAVRLVGPDILVFDPSNWSKGVVSKLKIEGLTSIALSPGKNPSIAVFVGERKGAPARISIHSLIGLSSTRTCQKSFFKADSVTMKWNDLGTQVLVLTHTDVDKTNKSYYGETGLYLLSASGNFDCRVTLDKEGPIHDFAWSPNSKEFGVIYGYMPAKATLFDQRVKVTAEFGAHPWNFISFNSHGRLVALAGFGNLAGKIDIFDRRTLKKECIIDAPNTSHCEWSPDGKTILTATLSPRLRVDNGIKIWHCTGPLLHVQLVEELYQASWRPAPSASVPPFPSAIPPAPAPCPSVAQNAPAKSTPSKPAGTYRPPGARGLATPTIYKREDEGGAPSTPSNGISTPPRTGTPVNGGNGRGLARPRYVPGAPPPAPAESESTEPPRKGQGKKKKDKAKKEGGNSSAEKGSAEAPTLVPRTSERQTSAATPTPSPVPVPASSDASAPASTPAIENSDSTAKKIRNLQKKLKAIEELKNREAMGMPLETTQKRKLGAEDEVRRELKELGAL